MLSINTNSAYTYGCQTAAYRRQNIQKAFAGNMSRQLTPPSVIHIGELGFGADNLGRQYALNYAEDSTEENPIVIAKGNDEYGQQFEEWISLNDIDLNHASYLEMAALAAHTKTDSCVPTAMTSGHHDYFKKENYVDDFNKCIADLYKMGSYDAALYETSILRKYMDYFQSIGKQQTDTGNFYVNRTDDSHFGIDTKNSISQEIEFPIETERYSETGFEAMKNDPEYEAWVLNDLQVGWSQPDQWSGICGGTFSTIYYGASKEECHAEMWNAGYNNGNGEKIEIRGISSGL